MSLTDKTAGAVIWVRSFNPYVVRAVVIPLGVAFLTLFGAGIETANLGVYDRVLLWQAHRQPTENQRFVMVEIDDRSIEVLGRFPWSRSTFADLFDRTREGHATVVGVDVLFAEAADPEGDAAMAEAMRSAGNVVLASVAVLDRSDEKKVQGAMGRLRAADTVIEPIPTLASSAAAVGSISILEDRDGSMRRYSLLVRHLDSPYPSLAQLMAGIASAEKRVSVVVPGDGTMLINYGSLSPAAVRRVSFSDVLDMQTDETIQLFRDQIVMVAATYTGGVDVGPTPLHTRSPSSFAHIYALNTLLTGKTLRALPGSVPFVVAVLMVGLLSTQVPARHPPQLMIMGAALIAVFFCGSLALFVLGRIVLGPALPIFATIVFVSGYGLEEWWFSNLILKKRNKELQETVEHLRRTRSAKERMEAELNIARDIQLSMLPLEFPPFPDRHEFDLHATLVPAREVGGDFYDFFFVDEHHLYLCVGDVSGKGVPAALFMAVSKTLLKSNAGRDLSPATIMTRTNDELARQNDQSMFVTVWLAVLDLRTGELRYTNAGHNPPYIWTSDRKMIRLDQRHGPVVAAVDGLTYREGIAVLGAGDTILLYTDGVPEAMDPEGALYEEGRLIQVIESSSPEATVQELVTATADGVWRFQSSSPQADDVTILALQYHGETRAAG